ncbi:MAG TPA: RodZ domain-containing protein [Geobacteraceae bacterium]
MREARESRGVSLDEAATVTRIGKNYLLALEEGEFDKLPNPAYVKGFLRVYAGFLGLSGDLVVARYERQRLGTEPREAEQPAELRPASQPATTVSRFGRYGIPAGLLGLVLLIAMLAGEKSDHKTAEPVSPVVPPAISTVSPRQASFTSASRPVVAPPPVAEPSPAEPAAMTGEPAKPGIVLRLKVNQDSWLQMTIDGNLSQQYDLKAGDLIEWKGERSFALELGNGGGVEAELNGSPLKPFGEQGRPVRVVVRPGGVSPE